MATTTCRAICSIAVSSLARIASFQVFRFHTNLGLLSQVLCLSARRSPLWLASAGRWSRVVCVAGLLVVGQGVDGRAGVDRCRGEQ